MPPGLCSDKVQTSLGHVSTHSNRTNYFSTSLSQKGSIRQMHLFTSIITGETGILASHSLKHSFPLSLLLQRSSLFWSLISWLSSVSLSAKWYNSYLQSSGADLSGSTDWDKGTGDITPLLTRAVHSSDLIDLFFNCLDTRIENEKQ